MLKLVLPILGGGLAGALLKEWYERKHRRLQRIPLIERVNRRVSTKLHGITLARKFDREGDEPARLEELANLREYQMTLRNTSTVHLRDVEIQFEFPVEDVVARLQRPALSKTALLSIDAVAADPWRKAFRWRIPYLPSGDSVEFTFQAVDPPSGDYEVALYNNDRVIVEIVKGEPVSQLRSSLTSNAIILLGVAMGALTFAVVVYQALFPASATQETKIMEGGCTLSVSSRFEEYKSSSETIWRIENSVFNAGDQPCIVQSPQLDTKGQPVTIAAGRSLEVHTTSRSRPKSVSTRISIGTNNLDLKTVTVNLF